MEMNIRQENNENTPNIGFCESVNMELLEQAMKDEGAGIEFALERIRIPSKALTAFEVPAGDGENIDYKNEIECVILLTHPSNSYYSKPYDGEKNPPDCASQDGKTGIGNPGGFCRECPYNQFSSGKGKAKACKNRRIMYILRKNELFPMMLILPPGSLKSYTRYVQSLLTKGIRLHEVVTKLSLRRATSEESGDFSQVVFRHQRKLSKKEQKNIDKMIRFVEDYEQQKASSNMMIVDDQEVENPFIDPETGEIIAPLN